MAASIATSSGHLGASCFNLNTSALIKSYLYFICGMNRDKDKTLEVGVGDGDQ